jgi:hypothetical protein
MLIDYLSGLEHALNLCNEFEKMIVKLFFFDGQQEECSTMCSNTAYIELRRPLKACVDLHRLLKFRIADPLLSIAFYGPSPSDLMESSRMSRLQEFKGTIKILSLVFNSTADEVSSFCSAFSSEERDRLNEAIHNWLEGCNLSSVAMSVSAVESRLINLMCAASPKSTGELEKKTLGQLIIEYANNKAKYRDVVPKRHEPLLQLCNEYRILSVHPKGQTVTPNVASAILSLAIEFLTDRDMRPEVVTAQLIANQGSQ